MSGIERELTVCVTDGHSPVVKLSGEINFRNRDLMREPFEELIKAGHEQIGADLSELEYMDSSAVSALVRCAALATESGSVIEIVGASPYVSRILTLCGAVVFFKSRLPEVPSCSDPENGTPTTTYWHVSHFRLPATPDAASTAADRISALIHSLPLTAKDRQDVLRAAEHALENAISHGCGDSPDKHFSVRCVAGPSKVLIDVMDPGRGFNPASEANEAGGKGIPAMRELMDEVSFEFSDHTRVRLIKNINYPIDLQPTLLAVPISS